MPSITLASVVVVAPVAVPTLTLATGVSTGETTATGTVTTDENNGTLYYLISTNISETSVAIKAGSSQVVSATGIQNVSFTSLTQGTFYYIHYLHTDTDTNDSNVARSAVFATDSTSVPGTLTLANVVVRVPGATIASVANARLAETVTITTSGEIDLTGASTLTATYGGITLAGKANVAASSVDFTMPSSGLEIDAFHDFVLTADSVDSAAFSERLLVTTGKGYVTLTSVDSNSFLQPNAGTGANAIGVSDQVVYDSFSTDNRAVTVDSSGLPSVLAAAADPDNQVFDWYYLDAQDGYDISGTQAFTMTAIGGGGGADITAPIISLTGASPLSININDVYTDAGATAIDDVDGDITANIVTINSVNTALSGSYAVTYNVSDAAANAAITVVRTVVVVDDQAPVITVTGPAAVTFKAGSTYVEQGATWTDNLDGTGDATIGGDAVNNLAVGTYTVRYNHTDNDGNPAIEATRVVTVEALEPEVPPVSTPILRSTPATTPEQQMTDFLLTLGFTGSMSKMINEFLITYPEFELLRRY